MLDSSSPEDDLPPLVPVAADEVKTPLAGPAVLYGQEARNGRRPNAPGRHGNLLLTIDSPYQIFGRSASYLHVAAWSREGAPAAGAQVYIDRKRVGVTNDHGTLVFRYETQGEDPGSGSLFVIDGANRCGAVSFTPYSRTQTFAVDRLYVYTDRGVFQPGETVHIRAIGWRLKHDYSPLASAPIEFLLRDMRGHTIAAKTAKTDEFGVTATDIKVPNTAEAGIYELRVAYGSERASTRLQVRRFTPPALRVEHTIGRFLLRSAPRALGFGVTVHPPANEKLKSARIDVTAKNPTGKLIARVEKKVKGNGPHRLSFTKEQIAALIAATPEGELATIEIDVRDHLGRRERLTRELRVTATPHVAILELDRDEYATGDPVSVVARVSERDSVPLRNTSLELTLKNQTITARTDSAGMATFALRMPASESNVSLSIPGQDKPIAATTLAHTEPTPMRTELGSPVVKERQTTTVAAVFPNAFSPAEGHVHMDITDTSGAIVGSKLLPVRKEGGRFVARGSFEAPSWGSMLLTFFALGRRDKARELGLLVSGQNLVVQTDRELQVELEGLSEAVRPGAPLAVRARVRDRQGKDVEFSLGAALVDRNILALKDPLEVTPMDRFYNPELRTMSTTGSKILTWPVVTRNWGSEQHDIALPPFPWRDGGGVESCKGHWDEEDYKAIGETMGMGFGSGHGMIGTVGHGAGGGGRVEITIRTRFPATALWEPHLKGKGAVDIRGRFPDSIGEQELIVVASDKRGGVGLVRKPVRVTQPVFIEADLPSPAIAGEEVWLPARVHNLTDRDASFTLELGGKRQRLAVAKGAAGAASMPLRMGAVGSQDVQLRAVGGGHDDRVVRRIEVAPRGVPIARVRNATLTSEPLKMAFEIPKGAADADAHLRIEFPAVTSAFIGIDDIARTMGDDPWSLATDLTSAALVLDLAKRHGVSSERIEELRGEALAALTMVARIQRKDGSFGYWRNGKSSPYITAVLLEGLLEARRIGLPAPKATIDKAAQHLAGQLESGELISVREIGWWEGDTTRVRYGITAEIFDALARLPADERRGKVGVAIDRLAQRYQKYLETSDTDPLAAGRALAALIRLGKITPANARRIATRLLRKRDEGHVEPSWFHAYGGRVDATLAVLEALELADPTGFTAEKRDALAWILSTRPSWGDWHNEAGTTAALRALALVGAAPSEVKGSVIVKLDGKVVHRADVDPKDPWLSTASLAHLDLGRHLRAGKHLVEVSYSGALRPAVSLTSRFWHKGKAGKASSKGVTLKVDGPHAVANGASASLQINASGDRLAGGTIVVGHSGLLDLDMGALSAMTGPGRAITALRTTARGLELRIAPSAKEVRVALPYHAVRRGRGRLPTVAWFGRQQPVVVDAGKLAVD